MNRDDKVVISKIIIIVFIIILLLILGDKFPLVGSFIDVLYDVAVFRRKVGGIILIILGVFLLLHFISKMKRKNDVGFKKNNIEHNIDNFKTAEFLNTSDYPAKRKTVWIEGKHVFLLNTGQFSKKKLYECSDEDIEMLYFNYITVNHISKQANEWLDKYCKTFR